MASRSLGLESGEVLRLFIRSVVPMSKLAVKAGVPPPFACWIDGASMRTAAFSWPAWKACRVDGPPGMKVNFSVDRLGLPSV